jgi:hypothetical protein
MNQDIVTTAWIQAASAVLSLVATAVLAVVAGWALLATRRQADAASEQASASTVQAEASRQQVREAERSRMLEALPLLGASLLEKLRDGHRAHLGFVLSCQSKTPAMEVQASIIPLHDRGEAIPGATGYRAAQVPIIGPGLSHEVSIEVTSFSTSGGRVGYDWMELRVACLGILGSRVTSTYQFAPNDAIGHPPGSAGFGQRFEFVALEADLDGRGVDVLRVGDGGSGLATRTQQIVTADAVIASSVPAT